MNFYRKAYSVVGVLLLLEYLLQFYSIGAGIFSAIFNSGSNATAQQTYNAFHSGDTYFAIHIIVGVFAIAITTLLLWAFSFGAKYPDRTTQLTGLLVGLLILQDLLAGGFPLVPAFLFQLPSIIAGIHPVNGVIMLILATWLVYKHWAFGKRGKESMAATPQA
jgi:thiamine transporter ThiT